MDALTVISPEVKVKTKRSDLSDLDARDHFARPAVA
jgi:hypothetical protein